MGSIVAAPRLWSTGSVIVVHGLSCSAATKIRDQTHSPALAVDSFPLSHQGSLKICFLSKLLTCHLETFLNQIILNFARLDLGQGTSSWRFCERVEWFLCLHIHVHINRRLVKLLLNKCTMLGRIPFLNTVSIKVALPSPFTNHHLHSNYNDLKKYFTVG